MRDRVAIVFMTLSVVSTLVLGGAVVHELGRKTSSATLQSTGTGTSAAGSDTSGDTGGIAASAATPGTPGSAGSTQTVGGTGAVAGAQTKAGTGALSTGSTGVSNGTITVGGIYDETGPFDATVERDTVKAYFNQVNAAGGVNGYKFQLVDCDSAYDPTRAHQCSQRLISQGVLAIVGWLSVSGEQPEADYLNSQGVPMIGGLGVPSEFSNSLSYPVTTNLTKVGTALGTHAKDLNIHAPGIVVLNANFIKPVEASLVAALHKQGITEKSIDEVDPTKADYTDEAIKLRSEGADSVITALDPFSYARMYQAFDRQNFHPKVLGSGLDKKSAEQQYGSAVYNAESLTPVIEPDEHTSTPGVSEYYAAVQKYFPGQVSALDVYSEADWVAAKVFVQAVRNVKGPVSRKTLVDALNGINNFDTGLTVPISYSPGSSHDPNHCFQWIQNKQGTWHTYSDWTCF